MWQFDECNDSKARNRLSLKAKVQAIEAYEKTPNYSKVGLMFKCSSKQIRTIVKNKVQIMALYASVPKLKSDEDKSSNKRRLEKMFLLGTVVYEWFLRARRNPNVCPISYKLIQSVALEVKKILNVDNFSPNSAWLLHFRQKFNISDSDMKSPSHDDGPLDLDIESIVADVVVSEKYKKSYASRSSIGSYNYHFSSRSRQSSSKNATELKIHTIESSTTTSDSDNADSASTCPKLDPIDVIEIESDDEDDGVNRRAESKTIQTIDQALQHLKPLEDFALMKEDFRVIGLISQLEVILKSSNDQ